MLAIIYWARFSWMPRDKRQWMAKSQTLRSKEYDTEVKEENVIVLHDDEIDSIKLLGPLSADLLDNRFLKMTLNYKDSIIPLAYFLNFKDYDDIEEEIKDSYVTF